MELLDMVDEYGTPTGEVVSREIAHQTGIRHRTSHVWLLRRQGNTRQILLQKRSDNKDSYPGCYDISSAGHIPAGMDFIPSALRELREELGIDARPEELHFCGQRTFSFEKDFHGKPFRDHQVSNVYCLIRDCDEEAFVLQSEEVSHVRWFSLEDCWNAVIKNLIPHCIYEEELKMVYTAAQQLL